MNTTPIYMSLLLFGLAIAYKVAGADSVGVSPDTLNLKITIFIVAAVICLAIASIPNRKSES